MVAAVNRVEGRRARRLLGSLAAVHMVAVAALLAGCGLGSVGYDADQRRADPSPSATATTAGAAETGGHQLGPYQEPPDGAPRVNLDIARRVLADYDEANNRANDARSPDALAAIESGAMREIDLASQAASRALDSVREYKNDHFSTGQPVFALQPMTTYPVRFLVIGSQVAEHDPGPEPTSTTMQFVRTSADSAWTLEHVANAAGSFPFVPTVDQDGYVVPTSTPAPIDPAGVGPAIVATLNGSTADVTFATDAGPQAVLAAYLEAREVGLGLDLVPSDGQTVGSWPMQDGSLLVLTTFRTDITIHPSAGQELVQPPTRDIFNPLLGPGRYADVHLTWLGLQAWTMAPGEPVALMGSYDGELAASGERTAEVSESPDVDA
jgi:hypothetical protein